MVNMANARSVAFEILLDIEKNKAYANLALDKALSYSSLDQNDRRLTTELVYGCVKMQAHLDTIIKAYSDIKRIDRRTLLILRMAIYQMDFMKKIPEHAILNEAVELAKQLNINSAGLINAILRGYQRKDKSVVWPDKRKQRNQYLAKWYSFPQWIIDGWVKEYGFNNTEKLCQYFNAPASTWIRVNTLKASVEEVILTLEQMHVTYQTHPFVHEAIRVSSFQNLMTSELFKKGKIIVQDLSAMLPALVLAPKSEEYILDMCAAPGGKTTYLSAIMNNSGLILACDDHMHRTKLIEQNVKRLGVTNVKTRTVDARKLPKNFQNKFDSILLDAPCSGLGVLNRRADLRWNVRRNNIDQIIQLQSELLDAATVYLKPQGQIIYSTCTLNKKENELQVEEFLRRHPEFSTVPFECLGEICESGYKTITPFIDGTDGFFIARLVRKDK